MAGDVAKHGTLQGDALPRRLRVLTLVDRIKNVGGGERMAIEIAKRLDPERFESILCVSRWDEAERLEKTPRAVLKDLEEAGVSFLGLRRPTKVAIWAWLPLLRLLHRREVDVIHGHMFGSNVWATLLGRAAGVPVVVAHEHVWSFEGQPLRRLIDREVIARHTDAFLAVSEDTRRNMIDVERIPPESVTYVANGIDELPPGDGSALRAELGLTEGQPLVGTVGLLRRQKALDVLIRAAAELAPRIEGLRVAIAGDGEEQEALEALIAELGLQDVVTLLGFRSDIPAMLAAFDVAVSSSDFEGSPLAVMEYMDAARPIVATAVGGVPELIEDGVTGRIVPPREPTALADAIGDLLEDRELGQRMGEAAQGRRRSEYSLDGTVHNLEELYIDLRFPKRPTVRPRALDRGRAPRRRHQPLILCYHAISEDWDSPLAVTPGRFSEQLAILKDKGYRSIKFSEVLNDHRDRVVAITFDDAYRSVCEVALPILEAAGYNATVFATTAYVGEGLPMSWDGIEQWALSDPKELIPATWSELAALREIGWEIGSHTVSHPHLRTLSDDALRAELVESREACARELGSCDSLAYPYGQHDERVVDAAGAAGYRTAATLAKRPLAPTPLTLPRVGVYRADDGRRFRLKVSNRVRAARQAWYSMKAAPVGE